MTPITRLLTFFLVLLLAILVAASITRWSVAQRDQASAATGVNITENSNRGAFALLDRGVMAISVSALAVSIILVFALGIRSRTGNQTRAPFSSQEREKRSLDLLATTSARAQAELDLERDEREKAQADAQHRLQLLNQTLEEQIRLGRDLHDGVIQSLYAAGLTLETATVVNAENPEAAKEHLTKTRELINHSIHDIRSYIAGLSPRAVRQDSFAAGLREAVEALRAGRPLDVDWKIDESIAAELSDQQISESLQITREATSNALRHGGAHRIWIGLNQQEGGVELSIRDDGTGFDSKTLSRRGNGLDNMAARASDALGEFELTSSPGQGTSIRVVWQTASMT
ncbi:MAG: hypothetical protein SynsKO_17760 [Synoicihabitans sp.]